MDNLSDLIMWALLMIGLTYLVTGSEILGPLRRAFVKLLPEKIGYPLTCAPCFSWWLGLFVSWPIGFRAAAWFKIPVGADVSIVGSVVGVLLGAAATVGLITAFEWWAGAPLAAPAEPKGGHDAEGER